MSKVLEAVDHLKQANLETTAALDSESCNPKIETQIKTEQDAEVISVRERVNPPLLNVKVVIGQTDLMPLLEAVDCLDSKIGSITTETETKTDDDTNSSSRNKQLMPQRSKIRAKISMTDQAMNTQEESSDVISTEFATIKNCE